MSFGLPNILTVIRIIIIPLIVLSIYFINSKFVGHFIAAILFAIAAITDFIDGYLARSLSLESNFGKFLDPVADKLLVGASIVILVDQDKADILPSLAIICREILVSGLREFLAEIQVSVPVSKLSKIKTFVQMIAIFLLFLGKDTIGYIEIYYVGSIALWVASILTIITGYLYLKSGMKHISGLQ